jgi:hypothetical protein
LPDARGVCVTMSDVDEEDGGGGGGGGEDEWTLADIAYGADAQMVPPSPRVVERLVDEFYAEWMEEQGLTIGNVTTRLMQRFRLDADEAFRWDAFDERLKEEEFKHMKLTTFLHAHRMSGGQAHEQLNQIADVIFNVRDLLKHCARLVYNLRPRAPITELGPLLPEEWRTPDNMEVENENIHSYDFDNKKNLPAMHAFVHLRQILQSCNYRRAHGKFFKRVMLPGDVETLAFEEAISIEAFVALHCSHTRHFRAWRWTMHKGIFEQVVSHLTNRPLDEAPDLQECRHLRSYGGDAYGRGAGVYDSRSDMIFWYHMRDQWEHMAQEVQERRRALYRDARADARPERRKHEQEYVCTAPQPGDVCVVHLPVPFPHDIYGDLVFGTPHVPRHLRWREAFAFEAVDHALQVPDGVAALLAERVAGGLTVPLLPKVGLTWQVVHALPPRSRCLDGRVALAERLRAGDFYVRESELAQLLGEDADDEALALDEDCHVTLDDGFAVPFVAPATRLRRVQLRESEWRDAGGGDAPDRPLAWCVHQDDASRGLAWEASGTTPPDGGVELHHDGLRAHLEQRGCELSLSEFEALGAPVVPANAFVRTADGRCHRGVGRRYFVLDLGRTWADVETPEIDRIFECQRENDRFGAHDRFFIYALLGRLFYEVGELDDAEMTLFFEGIGGSGKSTVLKAMYPFWAPHKRAILSSNMQPQFGMGSLVHGDVAFCTEVAADLNLPQEEWQDATGGAMLNLAIKHKEPVVVQWKSQFLWAGNAFPKRWRNGQGQVSRRLAGVSLNRPVNPRDGNILDDIKAKGGLLQRRCVLAYHLFVRHFAGIDPMSKPDRLPPAFCDFYRRGRRETDPMEDFLSLGTYVVPGTQMLLEHFRELYSRYRADHDMGKPSRWGPDLYKTPFQERGASVVRMERVTIDGQTYTNVDVVVGLVPAA